MDTNSEASKAGKALSKKGAAKGGLARAKAMSAEQRSDQSRAAALARWEREGKQPLPVAAHWDKPLVIAKAEIPAYVLDDGRRVLVQRGIQTAIGMSTSGGSGGAHRMARFIAGLAGKGVEIGDLAVRMENPILFRIPGNPNPAYGYEATILQDICEVILQAHSKRKLLPQQAHLAAECAILVQAYARVGIIALVDEATGYQHVRAKDSLAQILEAFIAKELRRWVKTFPDDFYKEMYRLKGWAYPPKTIKKPWLVGKLTNDVVYERLAPGVIVELRRVTPRNDRGGLKHKFHQRLTDDIGHPKLREHLAGVVVAMKLSSSWTDFVTKLDRIAPKWGHTFAMPLDSQWNR